MSKHCGSNIVRCGLCGVTEKSVRNPSEKSTVPEEKRDFADDFNKLVTYSFSTFFLSISTMCTAMIFQASKCNVF